VTLQASDERPHALADRDKVVQVLTNLLSNAPKFTSPGGQVWIRTFPQGGPGAHRGAGHGNRNPARAGRGDLRV